MNLGVSVSDTRAKDYKVLERILNICINYSIRSKTQRSCFSKASDCVEHDW